MVNISKLGDSTIKFTFTDNDRYLYNGEITLPLNSLILEFDTSDLVIFKKIDGDVFVTFLLGNSNFATKDELIAWYKENMVGSTGGGVDSGTVQTMIDESISGKADSSTVEQELETKLDVSAYTPVEVSSAITSGDTNPVAGGVLYDELRLVTPSSEVELVFENGYATNLPNNCSAVKITVTENEKWGLVILNNEQITISYWDNTLTIGGYTGETYDISGNTATIYLPSSFVLNSVEKSDAGDPYYINVAAITPSVATPLINQVSANTAAVSGKANQSDFTTYTADTTPKVNVAWQQGIRNPYLYFDDTSGITLQYSVLSGGNWSYDSLPTDDSIWYSKTGNSVNVLGVYATGATRTVNVNPSEINQRVYLASIPPSINMYWNASYTGSTTHYIAVSCLVSDGTNGYCQWNWDGSQYVPNSDYINTAVTLSYDSTNQVVTITPSSSSALTSIVYVRCNRNIAPATALTQDNCRIGLVTIDTTSYKLQEALDNKQDTLSAGTNITISGNVISAEGGGKVISGGTNISVTTGETADTINCTLPLTLEGQTLKTNDEINLFKTNSLYVGFNGVGNAYPYSICLGRGCNTYAAKTIAAGDSCSAHKEASQAMGKNIIAQNNSEHSVGQYNVSNSATTTFGDSGNTLFSIGNGTANNARHNAFEIRQNGDIYLSLNGQDVKLQDQLGGGSITVDSTLDSGSTNPVENQALYDELRIENAPVETTLTFTQPVGDSYYWTTNYPSGCTTLVGNILAGTTVIELYNNSSSLGMFMIECHEGVIDSVSFSGIEGTYSISGSVVTISYPNTTNVTRFRIREDEYQPDYQTYKAMATVAPTVLKNQVNDNTTALGGLKLQQISQSDYDNLPTKDSSTLYIII